MILVLLQNPWSPYYAGKLWPREDWLKAMWSSYSGKMLSKILNGIPQDEFWVDNANPICTALPTGKLKPNIEHIRKIIIDNDVVSIVACGEQAAIGVKKLKWNNSLIVTPHPAYRLLSNEWAKRCNEHIHKLYLTCDFQRIKINWKNNEFIPLSER